MICSHVTFNSRENKLQMHRSCYENRLKPPAQLMEMFTESYDSRRGVYFTIKMLIK